MRFLVNKTGFGDNTLLVAYTDDGETYIITKEGKVNKGGPFLDGFVKRWIKEGDYVDAETDNDYKL